MDLDLLKGFRPRLLYFDLEDYPTVPQSISGIGDKEHAEERYQLDCCSTGETFKVNGLPAVFVFKGKAAVNNHPDDLIDVVLTSIKDSSGNLITGCLKLVDAECYEEYEEFAWEDIFLETECVNTCQECLPKPVPEPFITNHKTIYPDFKVNNVDPYEAEQIFCEFGNAMYEKVLALKYGVKFCCPTDLMQSTIEHEILKMDMAEDLNACNNLTFTPGSCKKYTITIPRLTEGFLYFKDCNDVIRTVVVHSSSQDYNTVVCGITQQTASSIYLLTLNPSMIVPVQFVEGSDCE